MAKKKSSSRRSNGRRTRYSPTSVQLPRVSVPRRVVYSAPRPAPVQVFSRPTRRLTRLPFRAPVRGRNPVKKVVKGTFKNVFRSLPPDARNVSELKRAIVCAKRSIRKEVIFASGAGGRNNVRRYKKKNAQSQIKC